MQSEAFEAYRLSPPKPVTLPRLLVGLFIVMACWLALSIVLIIAASIVSGGNFETVLQTRPGTLGIFASFAGIWVGVWLAMRFLHREPIGNLLGVGGKLATGDFWRGFGAVVATSVLSEVLLYAVWPEMTRGSISLQQWLLYALPVFVLAFVQTSSEELLFRGYLMRGLANRFRSPWIWALIPGLLFLALHFTPQMDVLDVLLLVASIGALTVALTIVVYVTGNLGAAFGMHMANNLFAFLLIGHQSDFGQFALYNGAPVDGDLPLQKFLILAAISLVCVGLTVVLLLHRASPLRVRGS